MDRRLVGLDGTWHEIGAWPDPANVVDALDYFGAGQPGSALPPRPCVQRRRPAAGKRWTSSRSGSTPTRSWNFNTDIAFKTAEILGLCSHHENCDLRVGVAHPCQILSSPSVMWRDFPTCRLQKFLRIETRKRQCEMLVWIKIAAPPSQHRSSVPKQMSIGWLIFPHAEHTFSLNASRPPTSEVLLGNTLSDPL